VAPASGGSNPAMDERTICSWMEETEREKQSFRLPHRFLLCQPVAQPFPFGSKWLPPGTINHSQRSLPGEKKLL